MNVARQHPTFLGCRPTSTRVKIKILDQKNRDITQTPGQYWLLTEVMFIVHGVQWLSEEQGHHTDTRSEMTPYSNPCSWGAGLSANRWKSKSWTRRGHHPDTRLVRTSDSSLCSFRSWPTSTRSRFWIRKRQTSPWTDSHGTLVLEVQMDQPQNLRSGSWTWRTGISPIHHALPVDRNERKSRCHT